jgi:signal peptidase I
MEEMNMKQNTERNKLIAVLLGLVMPGLGQVYNGELLKGACLIIIYSAVFITGMRFSMLLPDKWLLVCLIMTMTAVLAVYFLSAIDAYRKAKHLSGKEAGTIYNKWYFYIASFMLGSVLLLGAVYGYVHERIVALYKIPSGSMQPQVLVGDRILVDNTAYGRVSPHKGDIIVFVYLDDRSKTYIKRIAALPGEIVSTADGKDFVVPHGHVFVLGDNRMHSEDSRKFGPVPLRDILGKARLICWSIGPDGVRWDRIGLSLTPPTR